MTIRLPWHGSAEPDGELYLPAHSMVERCSSTPIAVGRGMTTEPDSDEDLRLRHKARVHAVLAAWFLLCAGGVAVAYIPPLIAGQLSVWPAASAAITVFGLAWLIIHEIRAAVRAKRELALLTGRPNGEL